MTGLTFKDEKSAKEYYGHLKSQGYKVKLTRKLLGKFGSWVIEIDEGDLRREDYRRRIRGGLNLGDEIRLMEKAEGRKR